MCGRSGGRGRRSREQIATHPKGGGGGRRWGKRNARAPLFSILGGVGRWTNGIGQMGIRRRKEAKEGRYDWEHK